MANYYEQKGLTVKDQLTLIAVTPPPSDISFMRVDIRVCNPTDTDAFVKIALSNTADFSEADWIDAGHALFAVNERSTGVRILNEDGEPVRDTFYDYDGAEGDNRIIISESATSDNSSLMMAPSTKVLVWSNVSGVAVRVTGLTQARCTPAIAESSNV